MDQPITPELQSWIADQLEAGLDRAALLQSMCEAGWQADVAALALDQALEEGGVHATVPRPSQALTQARGPQPTLAGSPRQLDLGDAVVDVLVSLKLPRLVLLGNFLSAQECDGLIAAASPRMQRSLTVQNRTGGEELNPDRTSDGMFFRRGETELVARIEARIARLLNWPLEYGEGLQVLHYQEGAQYRPHYDYFDPKQPGTPRILQRGGQRVGTLVMYLNNPVRGGGTTFPDAGLEVSPQRGHAVFFGYDQPHPSSKTLHGGAPVLEGEKWVATKWLRERTFV